MIHASCGFAFSATATWSKSLLAVNKYPVVFICGSLLQAAFVRFCVGVCHICLIGIGTCRIYIFIKCIRKAQSKLNSPT